MSWIWAALMPHPPVIIPEVGKGREREAGSTLEGAKRLQAMLGEANKSAAPDVLLVLSPHQPYVPGALFLNSAAKLKGTLSRFGAPSASVAADVPPDALGELTDALKAAGIPVVLAEQPDITQDHGAIVPLLSLISCFPDKKLPPVIVGSPSGLTPEKALALGGVLGNLPDSRRWALLASGDLSHRLKNDGPYGFNPAGPVFDKAVVDALKAGDSSPLMNLPPSSCENAGECGMRSVLALLGLTKGPVTVLSYEGPFGVGYCNAFWTPGGDGAARKPGIRVTIGRPAARNGAEAGGAGVKAGGEAGAAKPAPGTGGHPYPGLARQTIAAHLSGAAAPTRADAAALSRGEDLWSGRSGCFVSIKNKDGSLRGCIGTFLPTQSGLDQEIMANAVSAATRDPRFPPMRPEELDTVRISVDVLSSPELVTEGMELNPAKYGVIVSKDGRRGLLLPDLPGVTSVEQQLAIAAQKGGIRSLDGAQIYRFTVDRYLEDGAPESGR